MCAYFIFREVAVKHQGMFWSLFCHFNNKIWCRHYFRLETREKVFKWELFLFSNLGSWSPVKTFVPAHLFFCFLLSSLVNLILKVWRNAVIDIERDSDSVMKAKLTHLSTSQRIHSVPALLFSRHIPGEFSLCSIHLKIPPSRHLWKTFVFLELLLLFDFIRQKITKCFVTWGNG